MSEYQYYEFVAINRPLNQSEMGELRQLTTRATISPTRLQNVYHWGDFKGNPDLLMEKYFDAFLYLANWGTHRFIVRLPRRLLTPETASLYCRGDSASARATATHVVLEFIARDEEGGRWVEDSEGGDWLSSLVPLRGDIASGDLRCLYLGWLLCAQNGDVDDEVEPPVPPGLGKLSAALKAFADFMRIDEDLIAVAAQPSGDRVELEPSSSELRQWIHDLPEPEKDILLLRVVEENYVHLRSELVQRFRRERTAVEPAYESAMEDRRTVSALLAAAEKHAEVRRREEAEREAMERARRQREEAEARARYLDTLVGQEEEIWRRVEALVEAKRAAEYDQAIQYLKDLRDLAARGGGTDQFRTRVAELRALNPGKQALLKRLNRAGL